MEYRYEDGTIESNPDFNEYGTTDADDGWLWLVPLTEDERKKKNTQAEYDQALCDIYEILVNAGLA
jgi:hypothetical protein